MMSPDESIRQTRIYCIVLYLLPVLNPKSYDGARVLEASGVLFRQTRSVRPKVHEAKNINADIQLVTITL